MRMYRHLIYLLLFTLFAASADGQSVRAYMVKGANAFHAGNFSSSLAYYQVVIEEAGDRPEALYYAGEAARQIRSYTLAERYFEAIPEEERRDDYALTDFYLAMAKKSLMKYDDAIDLFRKFANERHDLSKFRDKALAEIESCEWAKEMMAQPTNVEMTQLNESVNTIFSDFSPVMVGDTLYYTSTDKVKRDLKKKKKKKKKGTSTRKKSKPKNTEEVLVTKIFYSVNGLTGEPIRQNARGDKTFTANTAFSPDGNKMYYTICEQIDVEENIFRCEIFYRERRSNEWGRAIRLPDEINQPGSNNTQASIGRDEKTDREVLYFVSDRPGGKGKLDIWASTIKDNGEFASATNLADLNTPEDDMTPFFDESMQVLYFSSDGYKGFGGYDIFSTTREEKGWTTPENLGYPINSSYDDFYYTVQAETGKSFLASNRSGAFCVSPDKDCNLHDIYQLSNRSEIQISVFNEKDFSPIQGASIEAEDLVTGKTTTFSFDASENSLSIPIHAQHRHILTVKKDGYDAAFTSVNPAELLSEDAPKKNVLLKPWTQLIVSTLDAQNKIPLYGMSLRVKDLKDGTSRTYHIPTDKFECSIPVKTDRDYEIVAIKSGFDAFSEKVSMLGETGDVVKKELYLKSFFAGLPLTVYFDNNEPKEKPGSDRTACDLVYGDVYDSYFQRKGFFIEAYAGGISGMDGEVARMEANRFFDHEIQEGYYDLLKLSENLLFALRNGEKVELQIEGYASPLADGDYNRQLAERRIQTLLNHFDTYKNGVLKKYISKELIIKKVPFGETAASTEVSDQVADRRASVYSPKASRERRVSIGGFKIVQPNTSTSLKPNMGGK